MSDDGTFTWKARVRGCQCCKWKDERIAELDAKVSKMEEDIRGACGCTDGDDIRAHLKEYIKESSDEL